MDTYIYFTLSAGIALALGLAYLAWCTAKIARTQLSLAVRIAWLESDLHQLRCQLRDRGGDGPSPQRTEEDPADYWRHADD